MNPRSTEVAVETSPTPGRPRAAGLTGLARGGLASVAGSALSAVAGVLVVLAVTRALSPEAAGIFFTLTSVYLIAETACRLATSSGVVWAITRARALGVPGRVPALLRAAFTPVVALALLTAGILALSADTLAEILTGAGNGHVAGALRIMACLLPLTVVSEILLSATRGYGAIRPTVVVDRLGRSALQLAAVALVATTASLGGLLAAWALPWAISSVFAGWWLFRLHHASAVSAERSGAAEPSPAVWRSFWAFTAPRALTSIVQLVLQRLDIVLLTVLAGPAQAAVYTAATRFLVVGQFVNQALANVVEPRIGHLLTLEDRSAARGVYQAATGWLVFLTWPFYFLFAGFSDGLLDVFGSGYDQGVPVVLVLAGTMLAASAIGMVDVVLIMAGRTRWNLGNALAALALNVVLDVLLIPGLGVLGAAIGWAAAILLKNVLPLVQVWRHLGLHPFGAGTRTAVALSGLCFGLPQLVATTALDAGMLTRVGLGACGAVVYAAACWRRRSLLALDTLRSARRDRGRG